MRGSRAMLRRIETSALVSSGWSVAEVESWGAKFTITFILRGPSRCSRSTGGSCLNGSFSVARTAAAGISRAIWRSREGRLASMSQFERANALGAVAHQPGYMVLTFPHVERALQHRIALGVVVDLGHVGPLGEIGRLVRPPFGSDPENHGQQVVLARQILQGDVYVVAGVELKIEAEGRFIGGDGTGDILAGLLRLEDCRIGGKEAHHTPIREHDLLGGKRRASRDQRPRRKSATPQNAAPKGNSGRHPHRAPALANVPIPRNSSYRYYAPNAGAECANMSRGANHVAVEHHGEWKEARRGH